MSRIGKQPIEVPAGVDVKIENNVITIKGTKGELKREVHPNMKIEFKDNVITVQRPDDTKENRSLHGLFRSLIFNMVEGVTKGFEKRLEIVGVGYRANASGSKITLSLGYSHPIEYKAPENIMFEMDGDKKNIIIVKGIDKEIVGQVASVIRSYRKPEPYKGKGIRYQDEYVPRKAGKAAASAS
jgi:large subunit ribosomal protein L6